MKAYNRNILLAVDESENSRRAVSYVAQMLGGFQGFKIMLLHVIQPPEEDYFATEEEKGAYYQEYKKNIGQKLDEYRQILIDSGFTASDISIHSPERYCPSMGECILSEQSQAKFSTIVIGRKGLSRKEEFLFGSVSDKIVKHANDCTVWVVE